MPKTKFQEVVFCLLMSFFMVIAMELYNTGLRMHGLTNAGMLHAFREIILILPICFIMSFFIVERIVPKIVFQLVTPGEDKPVFVILIRSSVTVAFMCPIMSLVATFLFKEPSFGMWVKTWAMNFPMAICYQMFYCGPLVRLIFRTIFREKKTA